MNNTQKTIQTIPQNVQTIIIILGQCSLQNGDPHPWLIDRVNTAYSILDKENLNLQNTYFIVSGSDVSNWEYGISMKDKRHLSEAQLMHNLLVKKYEEDFQKKSLQQTQKAIKKIDISSHIIIESQARTTIQNFYHSFKIISKSKIKQNLRNIYVVTSDFHMKRAQYCFETMFFKESNQIIGTDKTFVYKQKIKYFPTETKWKNDYDKTKKYEKQDGLYNDNYLQLQTKNTAARLWNQIMKDKNG